MRCVALPGLCMSNRSVKFVPALFAGVVAGASLATMTDLRAQVISTAAEAATPATQAAADSCLSAPKGATPSGSHWYYRIDRVTKRQCWYLREESDTADDKFARAAPPASAPPQPRPARFGSRGAGVAAATNDHTQVDRRRTCRMGLPATPRRAKSARQSRANGCGGSPHRSCRIARAQPCRTCSRRRRCRRCDGTTLPPRDLWPIQPISRSQPPTRPQRQPPQAEEVQQPAVRSDCARRCGRGDGKADRIAAEAASGDGRRPRAGRPHGKRDRADRPHAGAPRHAPQAPRDVGFRKDESGVRRNRCSTTRTPGCGAPEVCTIRACPRTGHARPRSVHARLKSGHAYLKSGRAYPRSGRRACLKSGHARPRNGDTCPRIACPMIGSGSCRLRKCCPGSPAARRRDRNGSGGYFSSWRCSLRTNSVRPVRRSRLSRSALRIDCTSANASSTLWLTTI